MDLTARLRASLVLAVALTGLPLTAAPAHAEAAISFAAGRVIGTVGEASQTYPADMDGDDDVDVVTIGYNSNVIAWHENDGTPLDGGWTTRTVGTVSVQGTGIRPVDLDVDGDMDIVALTRNSVSESVRWFENDGSPQDVPWTSRTIGVSYGAYALDIGDIDGDGYLDIATAAQFDNKVHWHRNDGTPLDGGWQTFVAAEFYPNLPSSISLGDIDGDGDLDVAFGDHQDSFTFWSENDGTPADGVWLTRVVASTNPENYTTSLVDVDDDGDLDVASSSVSGDVFRYFENTGNFAGFWPTRAMASGQDGARFVHMADLDDDGDLDGVGANVNADNVVWMEHDGSPENGAWETRVVGTGVDGAVSTNAADVDGDGDLDILAAGYFDGTVRWYENQRITISVGDLTLFAEGNDGPAPWTVTISISEPVATDTELTVTTTNGTASAGSDYEALSTTATISANTLSTTVEVNVNGDTVDEPNETFTVTAASSSYGSDSGTVTITDDDLPAISVADNATISEGNAGSANATITISASSADPLNPMTVEYTTAAGTATADADYTTAAGTATITAGQTTTTVPVPILGDGVDEPNETFTVTMSGPSANATLSDSEATATIVDDDGTPVLSVADASGEEGENADFVVTASNPSSVDITFDASTTNETASHGLDYFALTEAPFTIPAGTTTKTVPVDLGLSDNTDEPDETFLLDLSNVQNATIIGGGGGRARGTIVDIDVPELSVGDLSVDEGDGIAVFTIDATSADPNADITVGFATTTGSAGGSDFAGASGTATITAGDTGTIVVLSINDDDVDELAESFGLVLSNASANAVIDDGSATATINDNDATPVLTIADASVVEGATQNVTVTASRPSSQDITFTLATSNGTAGAADYTALAATTRTIPAGSTSHTEPLTTTPDTIDELDETFMVNVSAPANATLTGGDAQALVTITDDDATPVLSVNDVTVTEGGLVTFTVTASNPSSRVISFTAASANGTAISPGDYSPRNPTVYSMAAGTTTKPVTVSTLQDTIDELDEAFVLNITGPANATLTGGDAQGQATLTDDDATPVLRVNNVTVTEGTLVSFTVTASNPSSRVISFTAASANGTALTPADYSPRNPTVYSMPAGTTTKAVTVSTLQDTVDELNETFFVNLTSPANATLTGGDAQGQATLNDDDATPVLRVNDVSVTEGGLVTFTVTASNASSRVISFTAASANGTALSGSDYSPRNPTVYSMPAGTTTRAVTVSTLQDALDEPNETFVVNLTSPANATLTGGDAQGQATLVDND